MDNLKTVLVVLLALTVLAFTNPDSSVHRAKVKDKLLEKMDAEKLTSSISSKNAFEATGSAIGISLGMSFLEKMIDTAVFSENYYLFSLTKFKYDGKEKTIGFGFLGKVFLLDNLNDESSENTVEVEPGVPFESGPLPTLQGEPLVDKWLGGIKDKLFAVILGKIFSLSHGFSFQFYPMGLMQDSI